MKHFLFIILFLIWLNSVSGQIADSITKKTFIISGFADFYYSYDFDEPANKLRPDYLYNHKRHNQPGVNLCLIESCLSKKQMESESCIDGR